MALASVLLAWAVHSPSAVVRAILQVKANPRPLIGEPAPFSPQEYSDFRRALIVRIRSEAVLTRALRNPRIAGLGPLQQVADPINWLQKNLIIELPENSEYLTITLKGNERDQDDLRALLHAVVNTFVEEEISQDRQIRESARNIKLRAAEELAKTIQTQEDHGNIDEPLKALRRQWRALIAEAQQDEINLGSEQRIAVLQPAAVIADRVPKTSE